MIRLSALLRKEGHFPIATAGFLNFSQPTFMDAVARCVRKGATTIFVQPYFLISGYYVTNGVPKLVEEAKTAYPQLSFHVAAAFDFHPALVELTLRRAQEADLDADALLLMAHGTPHEHANAAIEGVAEALKAKYTQVQLGFMELNNPSISEGAEKLFAAGAKRVVAVPYFLQLGGHVAEDLPEAVAAAQTRHPSVYWTLANHLSYDPLLLEVVRERLEALTSLTPA